ncbi:MAG TPA: 2-oxo acid dehydrogenase subunit E2 [Kofleriaceae bacterium]|nr:2-oxo acid dehydrogenase subunit E2 [Kofleriaceae bacterium]
MPNLKLRRKSNLSAFRKIALGTWHTAYDPSVYGSLTLRMERAESYLERFRRATGRRLTLSHMMAKAAGAALQAMPDANAILRLGGIYLRDRIGVFFQVALEDPITGQIDLSGTTIFEPEDKSLLAIVDEFEERTAKVRGGSDRKDGARNLFRRAPSFAIGPILDAVGFFGYTLNLDLEKLGVPNDAFGSIMITNVGSLGLEEAYPPLVPYSRVPIILAMGAVQDAPVVEAGQVVPGRVMKVCATFDHRVLDGAHAAIMVRTLRTWMEDPEASFGPVPE